jgi:hypothetical protein
MQVFVWFSQQTHYFCKQQLLVFEIKMENVLCQVEAEL